MGMGNKYYFAKDDDKKIDYLVSLNLKQYQMCANILFLAMR